MSQTIQLDVTGRRRSPATIPGYHLGRIPPNKGRRYPPDPPRVEEIVAVMRAAGEKAHGLRVRGLIAVLWRAGLRISEALMLAEADLEPRRGSLLVRHGKGGKRREVGMDDWGWGRLHPWLEYRVGLPVGPLFCVINGAAWRSRPGPARRWGVRLPAPLALPPPLPSGARGQHRRGPLCMGASHPWAPRWGR